MRTIKVSSEKFEQAVRQKAERGQFMRIPSTKKEFFFTGLLMPAGVWVPWPDNLTPEEMEKYIGMYGDIPDLFTPKSANPIKFVSKDIDEPEKKD